MMIDKMDYIFAIAKEQNLTRAAKRLFVAQSTLTMYLNRVERELGLKLFERKINARLLRARRHAADDKVSVIRAQALHQQLISLLDQVDADAGVDLMKKRQQRRHPGRAVHQTDADVQRFLRVRHLLKAGGQSGLDLPDLLQLFNAQRACRSQLDRRLRAIEQL